MRFSSALAEARPTRLGQVPWQQHAVVLQPGYPRPMVRDQAIGNEADIRACAGAGRPRPELLAIVVIVENRFALVAGVPDTVASDLDPVGVTGTTRPWGVSTNEAR